MKTKLRKIVKSVLLIGFFGILSASLSGQVLELNPTKSGFAWERYPDSANFNETLNFGDIPVQYSPDDNDSREAYLQFDLSEVNGIVTDVSLMVRAGQKKGLDQNYTEKEYVAVDDFYVEVYACVNKDNDWTQEELTWNNKLPADKFPIDTFNVPPDGSVSFELNNARVVDYVKGMVGAGKSNITFIFKASDPYTHSRAWITSGLGWENMTPVLTIHSKDVDATTFAIKDVFINEAEPDTNYNEKTDMGILNSSGKSRHAYVSFLKEEMPDFADDVVLQVFGTQKQGTDGIDGYDYKGQPEFVVEVFGVHDHNAGNSWDETTLTWSSKQPGTSLIPLAEIVFQANNKPMTYFANSEALTNFYNRRMAHTGSTNISFVLKAKNESDSSRAWISENNWQAAKLMASGKIRGASVGVGDNVYVDEANPFSNYDAQGDMHVALANGKHRIAYFKFDLSGLSQADEALLSITGGQQGSGYMVKDSFMVELYACEDKAWTEDALVWQTRPALTGDALATVNMLSGPKQIANSSAFSSYINNSIKDGITEITLALKAKYETFSADDSIRAWVWAGGSSLDLFYQIDNTIPAPTFDPAPGIFIEDFSVTLSTEAEGAEIYYTIDGTAPTSSSTLYTAPINITADMGLTTVRAVTIKDGARSEETTGDFAVADQKPYSGSPVELPATVYAVAFDLGGPNVAYQTTASQASWSTLQDCRSDNAEINGVTGDDCAMNGGGLGSPSDGQWMEYTVMVPNDITCYNLNVLYKRAPSPGNTAAIRVQIVDDMNEVQSTLVDSVEFEQNCDTWDQACDYSAVNVAQQVYIPAGRQVIRVTHLGRAWNFETLEFIPASGCVQSVENHDEHRTVEIYPNPVNAGMMNVRLNKAIAGNIQLSVYDVTGKNVMNRTFNNQSGTIEIPVSLRNGLYFVKIEADGVHAVERVIVQ